MSKAFTALLVLTILVTASISHAEDDPKAICAASFTRSQELKDAGTWVQAREHLITCSSSTCPSVVSVKCNEWLEELDSQLPTITVRVTRDGADVVDAQVSIDGSVVANELDGQPIAVDPGEHTVAIRAGTEEMSKKLVTVAGEKARGVTFELASKQVPLPAPPPDPTPPPGPIGPEQVSDGGGVHPLVWIGYGVGAAAIIVGAITGGVSLSKASDIDAQCVDGQCPPGVQDDIDSGTVLAHVSTAMFAIGGAGLVLGTIGLFLGGDDDEVGIHVGPTSLMITGSF